MNQREHPFLESDSKELCLHGVLGNETFALPCSLHRCRLLEIQLTVLGWEGASLLLTAQACVSVLVRAQWGEETQASVALKGLPYLMVGNVLSSDIHLVFSASTLTLACLLHLEPHSQCRNVTPLGHLSKPRVHLPLSVWRWDVLPGVATDLGHQPSGCARSFRLQQVPSVCEPGVQVCCLDIGMLSEGVYWRQPEWAVCLHSWCPQTT